MSLVGIFLLKFVHRHLVCCKRSLKYSLTQNRFYGPWSSQRPSAIGRRLGKKISFLILIFTFNSSDHLNAVGAIKISDGSLQDFHKALDHVLNLLKDQLTTPGKLNETEFVRLWFNLHSYFNNFDTSE